MYFDRRLWQLTRGMRWRIVATVLIGLASAAVGMARFVFLGTLLARVFAGAPAAALILPAAAVAAAVLMRGLLEHARIGLALGQRGVIGAAILLLDQESQRNADHDEEPEAQISEGLRKRA